jgi:hypothetical protein
VEQGLYMVSRRLALGSEIGGDQDINELVVHVLDSMDALSKYTTDNYAEIYMTMCEIVENLGIIQTLKTLKTEFSVNVGDPNDPTSYHGDTSSSLGDSGGGCSIYNDRHSRNSVYPFYFVLLILLFWIRCLNKRYPLK